MKQNAIYINNKGQALLFVVVALTISMVVGVSVATRTLSVTKRVSSTDTGAKVFYAAEAGIERFVDRPTSELIEIANGTSCGGTLSTLSDGACTFTLGDSTKVETKTSVTVQMMTYNKSNPDRYEVRLKNGTFSGIALSGYSGQVNLCWRDSNESANTGLYYTLWSPSALMRESIILPNATSPNPEAVSFTVTGSSVIANNDTVTPNIYRWCTSVDAIGTPYFLNVMSLGGDAVVGVLPAPGLDIPPQGFQITSKATLNSADSQQQAVKIIVTDRSYSHVPGFFNAAIYAQKDIVAN